MTTIARDRGGEYIKGATAGAPDAIQVADRWHLLKNVREMLEQFLQNRRACLKAAAEVKDEASSAPPVMSRENAQGNYKIVRKARQVKGPTKEEQAKQARRLKKEERYRRTLEMKAAGSSNRAIRRELGMHTKTVRKYWKPRAVLIIQRAVLRPANWIPTAPTWSKDGKKAVTMPVSCTGSSARWALMVLACPSRAGRRKNVASCPSPIRQLGRQQDPCTSETDCTLDAGASFLASRQATGRAGREGSAGSRAHVGR